MLRFLFGVLTLSSFLVLAACSGGSSSSEATATPSSTSPANASASPQPTPSPSGGSVTDPSGGVSLLVDYYQLINNHDYASAYRLWAGDGSASGQTLEQFSAGYQGTDAVNLLINAVAPASSGARADVTILSVVQPAGQGGEQKAQRFDGDYSLSSDGGQWRIAAASIRQTYAETPVDLTTPLVVLQSYYAALDAGNTARAYTYWDGGGTGSGQSYADFQAGYASTLAVAVVTGQGREGAAAGSLYTTIPIALVATQDDGSMRAFCGSYDLRRANIRPFDALGWRVYSASISEITSFDPATDSLQGLLDGGC